MDTHGKPQPPLIACDMSAAPDSPAERAAEYRRLFAQSLLSRSGGPAGVTFRFRADPGVADWVRDLARREEACCPFSGHTIEAGADEVRWDVSVPDSDAARQILAALASLAGQAARGDGGRPPVAGPPGSQ